MARLRVELDRILRSTLGTSNVYFDPPESFKLQYPCIVYSFETNNDRYADDSCYNRLKRYTITYITKDADDTKLKYLEDWESTIQKFEAGDYVAALAGFKALSAQDSKDNVAAYYIELIETFFAKGKVPTEADDFGVAYNTENPSDMNPEWVGTKYEIKGTFRLLQK